ncbi:MAG TPA: hypothetical protein VHX38_26505 [Pseudonocardiaceae bacterium]|jgi:hypothetical protein|nr:hypothetical protein [Pseudonocardiaceae bacterium]
MSSEESTEARTTSALPERKLIRVRGVRAKPGGWVWVNELADGWATFPDRGAGGRRWQWGIGILIVVLFPVDALVQHDNLLWTQFGVSVAIVVLILALVVIGNLTDDRKAVSRWRARNQSMLRAGGRQALAGAIRTHGRARTVGEMNILLSSLGRTDPVFSWRRISTCTVNHSWWRTTVVLRLTGNHSLTYRTYGVRSPGKLARVFASRVESATAPQR